MRNEHGARVFCGGFHSFLLKKDNSLFGFGYNGDLQLALPENGKNCFLSPTFVMKEEKICNVFCAVSTSFLLMEDGSLFGCGGNRFKQLGIEGENIPKFEFVMGKVKQVFARITFTAILKENGEVITFGKFQCNQLSGKEGDLQRKLQVGEQVILLPDSFPINRKWKFECHNEFGEEIQENVFFFLLCMKRKIPNHLKLPKPILQIVINLSL